MLKTNTCQWCLAPSAGSWLPASASASARPHLQSTSIPPPPWASHLYLSNACFIVSSLSKGRSVDSWEKVGLCHKRGVKGLSNVPLANRLMLIGLCTPTCRSLYMPQMATTLSYMQRSGSTDQRSQTHVVQHGILVGLYLQTAVNHL